MVEPFVWPNRDTGGMRRMVRVMGATTTLLRTGIASLRDTTRTGRCLSFGVSRSQSSP
jgi:hypothetical protein